MSDPEFRAALELLAMLFLDWRIAVLILLLIAASVFDYRSQRIPNRLVQLGVLFGLIYNIAFPPYRDAGMLWPFAGMGLGFLAFLPLYLISATGAGDVKLMAMVGAFVGPFDMIGILLCTMAAGGVLSLLLVLARGTGGLLLRNLTALLKLGFLSGQAGIRPDLSLNADASAGKLPYALAISTGTIAGLLVHQFGIL